MTGKPTLYSWVGTQDLRWLRGEQPDCALRQVVSLIEPGRVVLLSDWPAEALSGLAACISTAAPAPAEVRIEHVALASPADHDAVAKAVESVLEGSEGTAHRAYNLSSGTPAMATVWAILGSTRWPGDFWQSSRQAGALRVELPWRLSLGEARRLLSIEDARIRRVTSSDVLDGGFRYRSQPMADLLSRARRVAQRDLPVLVRGPTGSGKELTARYIHDHSVRADGPFVAVNCGAIPRELIASELFGAEKGAHSTAAARRDGLLHAADGGTLFLDEVGELPLESQVALLRVLQDRRVRRVGGTRSQPVDFRVVAATHRALVPPDFREDLYYRLAVGVLQVPSLSERPEDIEPIAGHALLELDPDLTLNDSAFRVLKAQPWPGNVRQLRNVVARMVIWAQSEELGAEDAERALELGLRTTSTSAVLERGLGDGFDLEALLDEVRAHYLTRALRDGGSHAQAARLLGLSNRQKVRYHVERLLRERGVAVEPSEKT